jgi:DNA-binding GntR family transcriptional regulator
MHDASDVTLPSTGLDRRTASSERCGNRGLSDETTEVYGRIKALLVNFAFFPGEKVRIPELADHLRVSVTPVREALHRLYAEKLLDSMPKRGFYVRNLDLTELRNVYTLLNMLLKSSVEEYCNQKRTSPSQKLAPLRDTSITAVRLEQIIVEIAGLAGNRELSDIVSNVLDRTHYIRRLALESRIGQDEILQELTLLVDALNRRDLAQAALALDQRLKREHAWLPGILKEAVSRLYCQSHS